MSPVDPGRNTNDINNPANFPAPRSFMDYGGEGGPRAQYNDAVRGQSTANGVPFDQFPMPGASRTGTMDGVSYTTPEGQPMTPGGPIYNPNATSTATAPPEVKVPGYGGAANPQAMAAGQGWYIDSHGQFRSDNDGANIRANRPFANEGFSVGPNTLISRGEPRGQVGSPDYVIPSYGEMQAQGRTPNLYGYGVTGETPQTSVPIPGYQPPQGPPAMNTARNQQDQVNQTVPTGQGGFPTAPYSAPMQVAIPGMGQPQGGQSGALAGSTGTGGLGSLGGNQPPYGGGSPLAGVPQGQAQGQGDLTPNQRIQINPDGSVQVRDKSGFLAPSQWSEANTVINQSNRFDPNMIDKLEALAAQTVDPALAARAKDQLSAHPMDYWNGKAPNGGAFGTDIFEQWRQAHTQQNQANGIPGQAIAPYAGGNIPFEKSNTTLENLVNSALDDNVAHRTDSYGNFFYTDPATGKEVGPISQAEQPRLLQELEAKKAAAAATAEQNNTPARNNNRNNRSTGGPPPPPPPAEQIPYEQTPAGIRQRQIDLGKGPGQANIPY
jgi:hypothetical protein